MSAGTFMWLPLKGYEETYEVSADGVVRRKLGFWCTTDRPLVQHESAGYFRVSLSRRGRRNPHKQLVHRLVYETFVGPVPAGLTVNHKNGIKTDNRLANLELMTRSQQQRHAYATGLQRIVYGEDRGRVAKLTTAQVLEIRALYNPYVVTMKQLAARFGVSAGCIDAIVTRRRWAHI